MKLSGFDTAPTAIARPRTIQGPSSPYSNIGAHHAGSRAADVCPSAGLYSGRSAAPVLAATDVRPGVSCGNSRCAPGQAPRTPQTGPRPRANAIRRTCPRNPKACPQMRAIERHNRPCRTPILKRHVISVGTVPAANSARPKSGALPVPCVPPSRRQFTRGPLAVDLLRRKLRRPAG